MIPVFIGYDTRESIAFHVCAQSIIEKASRPISIIPLALNMLNSYNEHHKDGSNSFIYSRFLVPHLQNYQGWAIYIDGDMIIRDDIAKLFSLRNNNYALMVAKHDYETKFVDKYLGSKNENYPRKNWSSVMLWNCGHDSNKTLTPDYIETATGSMLHRFSHLKDESIGEIPKLWNWLAEEYEENNLAQLIHYTLGAPCFNDYKDCSMSGLWWDTYNRTIKPMRSS